jgi:hypothetical protein
MAVKNTAWIAFALAFAVAPTIATAEAPDKPPPACVATYFPPLPPGTTAGDYQVGVYDSPPARIELHGESNGHAINYYMLINGKRIYAGDAPASMMRNRGYRVPAAVAKCLAAKDMPKPQCTFAPGVGGCVTPTQGQGLMVVVARAGNQWLALLYLKQVLGAGAFGGIGWRFCSAGAF